MEYFSVKTITPAMRSITDLTKVRSFLIEGSKRAALVDTGTGVGHIGEYIRSLTEKELIVIGTHGHPDHIGGADEFDEVYLSEKDFLLAKEKCGMDSRKDYAELMFRGKKDIGTESLYFVPERKRSYSSLIPEMKFDLGGITVRALPFPGHTQGMTAILIEEERNVILGDACNRRVFLFSEEASNVEQYCDTCRSFQNRYRKFYDRTYMSHGPETLDISLIPNMIETCEDILAGRDDRIEIEFMGEKAYLAKDESVPGTRRDGRTGNIAYVNTKIYQGESKGRNN
ncbi:MBL fold metallo-hydrolase [Mediterraneibacter gnavus]|uniref:MBL fold metallo-hydrolase n=1 Tax=Mediterraneibacter gnavus TaxID=33038 RepID=UPI00232DD030|nr:MBL fold metallo-hydrolase [Mediterraneibacter gnavus]MDB8711057.1 MBL fold metallo-hydrolase [Mediterraneibacter gnavus]MDB8714333.1 MBL fold metallo-hydrolase [Mediterraneibacter gnavus]